MILIAWKGDFKQEGACREIHSRGRAQDLMDQCISSCPVTHTISQAGRDLQSCTVGSCNTALGTCGMGSSRPGAVTPVPATCPCAPRPRNPDTRVTQGTAVHTASCTGRDTEFPNPFLKDTIFHVRNAVMILKDSPSELKGRHSMFRYLAKSHKQLFFRLTPAIPPDNGQNGTAGYLSSCLRFRRALLLLTWWYFHLNCIAPSRCRLHDRPNAQHYCT